MQKPITTVLIAILIAGSSVSAADRTTCVLPQSGATRSSAKIDGRFPDAAVGEMASDGWQRYMRVWQEHHADPSEASIRSFLGLPLSSEVEAVPRRGRSAPRWLPWRLGSYTQIDTPHFTIFSRADHDASREVAIDLERCYWVWTQMFFPLWEGSSQVSTLLADADNDVDISQYLHSKSARITTRRKLRVVLFRDANEYKQTLGNAVPGIERSTGYYNDEKQTTFLYAADVPDRSTRRHEMVHQLFREATRSSLGRMMPAEKTDFWLIEGIAGYFESLRLTDDIATVGGWDASRLQFARHRIFVGGDVMSFDELSGDGRLAAQKRQDIARWYAHAIAQTHHLMDRGDVQSRQWIYRKLAELYKIESDVPPVERPVDIDRGLKSFLSIEDEHLRQNAINHELTQLCLAGCQVSSTGLATIPTTSTLRWLDLSGLPVSMTDVRRLAPNSSSLVQLSLERTRIDHSIVPWLSDAKNLRELDLSSTPIDDQVVRSIAAGAALETLWLTGTRVSDASIDLIAKMPELQSVDLQRTGVTDAGVQRLKTQRPNLEINPLELRNP